MDKPEEALGGGTDGSKQEAASARSERPATATADAGHPGPMRTVSQGLEPRRVRLGGLPIQRPYIIHR